MSMAIGGFVITSDGRRDQMEPIVFPDDDDVRKVLNRVACSSGVVDLRYRAAPAEGPYKLVLYVEDGLFLPMLNEYDRDGEHQVRTLDCVESEKGLVTLLGEKYPSSATTTDLVLVCDLFLEFLRTGDVSKGVMTY